MKRTWRMAASVATVGCLLPAMGVARGQSVSAVPKLDLNRYVGVWYEIARLPVKAEKKCADNGMVLYALGDKAGTFQLGTSCQLKNGSAQDLNQTGKLDKNCDGELKLSYFYFFSKKYWVLALGPTYDWALVGTPNHKSLWVLSRTAVLAPEVLTEIEAKATAEGYPTAKLAIMPQGGADTRSVLTTNGAK